MKRQESLVPPMMSHSFTVHIQLDRNNEPTSGPSVVSLTRRSLLGTKHLLLTKFSCIFLHKCMRKLVIIRPVPVKLGPALSRLTVTSCAS